MDICGKNATRRLYLNDPYGGFLTHTATQQIAGYLDILTPIGPNGVRGKAR